ncbi:fructokinase [Escherichia coli O111:H11 str. CVM9534]|nr:fructokinase [Escherichia coli O111:H11 str. CVM9534]
MRIGIALGGTKTEVIALGDAGEQLYRHRLPTPRDDYRQTIETIATLVDMAEQATGAARNGRYGHSRFDFALHRCGEECQFNLAQRSAIR